MISLTFFFFFFFFFFISFFFVVKPPLLFHCHPLVFLSSLHLDLYFLACSLSPSFSRTCSAWWTQPITVLILCYQNGCCIYLCDVCPTPHPPSPLASPLPTVGIPEFWLEYNIMRLCFNHACFVSAWSN